MDSVPPDTDFYKAAPAPTADPPTLEHLRDQLLARLHHAPKLPAVWTMFWTPNGGDGDKKVSYWLCNARRFAPPASWGKRNIYVGINPSAVRRAPHEASTNATIGAVNALLAEFDAVDFVRKAEWLPHYVTPDLTGLTPGKARGALQTAQTAAINAAYKAAPATYKARALAHLRKLSIAPTASWDSGGGYQAVWLLRETVYLYHPDGTPDPDAYARMAHLQRRWVAHVGGDPAASDLRRVLRWPGSENRKPKYAPNFPRVEFVDFDLGRVYDLADLEAQLPPEEAPPPRTPRRVHVPSGVNVDLAQLGTVPDLPRHPALDQLNRDTDLRDLLLGYGYTATATGARLNRPGGDSGGVEIHADNTATIYSSADPLYCGHRITPAHAICVYDHAGNVDEFLATLPEVKHFQDELAAYTQWLASPAAIVTLKAAGFRNPEQARKLLDAILQKCGERGTWRITPGYAWLARASTIANGGLGRYLARLFAAGLVDLATGATDGDATAITLLPPVLHNVNSSTDVPLPIHIVKNWPTYREHREGDTFINGHAAYTATRTQATLAPLGANGLGALLALQGGPTTIGDAAAAVGYSYGAMARTLRRYVEHGLATVEVLARGRKVYTLAADWRVRLEANLPKLTTYAVGLTRQVGTLKRKAALLAQRSDPLAEDAAKRYTVAAQKLAAVKAAHGIVPYHREGPEVPVDPGAPRRRRRTYAQDLAAAEAAWPAVAAWAEVNGRDWRHLDQTGIIGLYRLYTVARRAQIVAVHRAYQAATRGAVPLAAAWVGGAA